MSYTFYNYNHTSGNINITNTSSIDVTSYNTAQIVDANLIASNIRKGVTILGITGTYEGGEYDISSTILSDGSQKLDITDAE